MVASSEQHNAPVMVRSPATAQASNNQPGAPVRRADSAEVMKMPEPIIEPITIMVASSKPSLRSRWGDLSVMLTAYGRVGVHSYATLSHVRTLTRRRANLNSLLFQMLAQSAGEFHGIGRVSMNTNRFGIDCDISAIDGLNSSVSDHPDNSNRCCFRIV